MYSNRDRLSWPFTLKNTLAMTREFLSDNEIVELVNNLSDLEVNSEEELVCCNHYDMFSGTQP